jgi:U3 small nucleolar RNA-associated protein 4
VADLYETKLFLLSFSNSDLLSLQPTRIRSFVPALTSSPALSHLSLDTTGCGASSLMFTRDSRRLILGLVASAQLVVIDLIDEGVEVAKCFKREERIVGGRVVKGSQRLAQEAHSLSTPNGKAEHIANGVSYDEDAVLVDKEDGQVDQTEDGADSSDEDSDGIAEQKASGAWISCLTASEDGQWLALSDLSGRTEVYSLDTLQLHSTLPTLPHSPISLQFSSSFLLLLLPTSSISTYSLDSRQLLPPTNTLAAINRAISTSFSPALGFSVEPSSGSSTSRSRLTRIVIWAHDWLCTARVDMDTFRRRGDGSPGILGRGEESNLNKNLRRKRAREAREARDMVSASVSVSASGSVSPRIGEMGGLVVNSVEGDVDIGKRSAHTQGPRASMGSVSSGGSGGTGAGIMSPALSQRKLEEGFKMDQDKFRGVMSVEWLGSGGGGGGSGSGSGSGGYGMGSAAAAGSELAVFERPWGDYVTELPPAFLVGTFGRT